MCYVDGRSCCIRVLDLHQASSAEEVIDLDVIGQCIWKPSKSFLHAELLHYQDGVLSFLCYTPTDEQNPCEGEDSWLVAINIQPNILTSQRIRLAIMMQTSKFWVRNDSHYLYVGSHDGRVEGGHHEWVLQGYSLTNGLPTPSLQLCNMFGTDLRQTVVFEIDDGYMYALSNQSSFEVEEIDWTSYYHCYRFPVHDPVHDQLKRVDIWRRQHREGPINDSWTDLGLHKDERTGDLLITECRREWKDGLSTQKRTYYSEPLKFPSDSQDSACGSTTSAIAADESPNEPALTRPTQYPFNDPLYKAVGEENKPLYSDPVPRIPRNFHPEYSTSESPARTFLLAKTKHRAFIPASKAYSDLVQDNYTQPPTSPHRPWQQQLHLRIGSRFQSSPIDKTTKLLHERSLDGNDMPIPGSEERFKDRGIRLWPPADAPVELLDLLNPAIVPDAQNRFIGEVTAVTDERSVVYMPGSMFRSDGVERNIVLINFDPGMQFHGLTPLQVGQPGTKAKERSEVFLSGNSKGKERGRERGGGHLEMRKQMMANAGPGTDLDVGDGSEAREKNKSAPARRDWWRHERARYLEINRGYRFSYEGVA